jgi:hypothetical protein
VGGRQRCRAERGRGAERSMVGGGIAEREELEGGGGGIQAGHRVRVGEWCSGSRNRGGVGGSEISASEEPQGHVGSPSPGCRCRRTWRGAHKDAPWLFCRLRLGPRYGLRDFSEEDTERGGRVELTQHWSNMDHLVLGV